MTEALFRADSYLRETRATVIFAEPRGIALDRTVFYPQGGGQGGDQGVLVLDDGATIAIVTTVCDVAARRSCTFRRKGPRFPTRTRT